MKKCRICGTEIVNGVNGCAMYDTCTKCKPIYYPPTIRFTKPEPHTDYENAILARQEED